MQWETLNSLWLYQLNMPEKMDKPWYRPNLDEIPIEEVDKGWQLQQIVEQTREKSIVEVLRENGRNPETDLYLRKPSLEELFKS